MNEQFFFFHKFFLLEDFLVKFLTNTVKMVRRIKPNRKTHEKIRWNYKFGFYDLINYFLGFLMIFIKL